MSKDTTKPSVLLLQKQLMADIQSMPGQANVLLLLYLDAAYQLGKQVTLRELAAAADKIIKERDDE